jgi:hypothetical protein
MVKDNPGSSTEILMDPPHTESSELFVFGHHLVADETASIFFVVA